MANSLCLPWVSTRLFRSILLRLRNCHEVLGISPQASRQELKHRYHELARSLHPDVSSGEVQPGAQFAELREAYEACLGFARPRLRRCELHHRRRQGGQYRQSRQCGQCRQCWRHTFRWLPDDTAAFEDYVSWSLDQLSTQSTEWRNLPGPAMEVAHQRTFDLICKEEGKLHHAALRW